MPIFEYECGECGVFDILQLSGEKDLKYCPGCASKNRKNKVVRKVSASAFHLKGSGWYKTDYVDSCKQTAKTTDSSSACNGCHCVASKDSAANKDSVSKIETRSSAKKSSTKISQKAA